MQLWTAQKKCLDMQDIFSSFLIAIMKTNNPRHIRYHIQTDLEEKKWYGSLRMDYENI